MNQSLDDKYELTQKLDRIEDKILERGSLTKILGKEFSLSTSIDEIQNDEDMGHCFDLVIKITSPKKSLNDEKAEEISDHIGDNLFELIELENGEEARDEISGLLRESLVFFNEERVYQKYIAKAIPDDMANELAASLMNLNPKLQYGSVEVYTAVTNDIQS